MNIYSLGKGRALPQSFDSTRCRCLAGSFGLCDPASKEMHHYLERLEEQQRLVLELITGKKQQLLDSMGQSSSPRAKQVTPSHLSKPHLLEHPAPKPGKVHCFWPCTPFPVWYQFASSTPAAMKAVKSFPAQPMLPSTVISKLQRRLPLLLREKVKEVLAG